MTHCSISVYFRSFYIGWWAKYYSALTYFQKWGCLCHCRCVRFFVGLPGAESVLSHPLLLQQTGVLQFDWAGDEAHLAALFHQTPDPPVIVVLLHTEQTARHQQPITHLQYMYSTFTGSQTTRQPIYEWHKAFHIKNKLKLFSRITVAFYHQSFRAFCLNLIKALKDNFKHNIVNWAQVTLWHTFYVLLYYQNWHNYDPAVTKSSTEDRACLFSCLFLPNIDHTILDMTCSACFY